MPTAVKLALLCNQKTSGVVLIGSDLTVDEGLHWWRAVEGLGMIRPDELQIEAE